MSTTTPVTSVMGYLASNWPELNGNNPAVVLNPQAGPLDLLAWVWGELRSVQAAADVLAGADEIEKGDFSVLIPYRLEPLIAVFNLALLQLRRDALVQSKDAGHVAGEK